jgi:hypothetical protein
MREEIDAPVIRRRSLRDFPGLRQRAFGNERYAPLLSPDEPDADNEETGDNEKLRERLVQEYREKP